jgi:hypothetical protein
MAAPSWFAPDWRDRYARLLAQIRKLEALAKLAGRKLRP